MRWYRRLSGRSNFQSLSDIGRRKTELMRSVAWLAFGNLAVYAGLQAVSGNSTLLAASLIADSFRHRRAMDAAIQSDGAATGRAMNADLAPDKRHPQSDPAAQDEWKKTPRNAYRNPSRLGAR